MIKILINNIVVLNGGDGAILFGMIKALQHAFGEDVEILVYASRPDVARRMYPEIEFRETLGLAAIRAPFASVRYLGRIFRTLQQGRYLAAAWCWRQGLGLALYFLPRAQGKYLREYASADLVISSGGTYLKEEYGITSQACDYRITLMLGRPLAFFTQTLGPFTRSHTRRVMASILNRALCILLRDGQSRRNVEDLGVDGVPMHLAADAAFALADPVVLKAAQHQSDYTGALRVAVSVRYWPHFSSCSNTEGMDRYRQAIAAAVRRLVELGAEVTFVSTCQGISEYDDDAVTAEQVVRLLDTSISSRVQVIREFVRFDKLMLLMKQFDFCIGTRMHMCILSLICGVPVLPIAYEFKTKELFKQIGMGDWVSDIESIEQSLFADRTERFLQSIPSLRAELFINVEALYNSAMQSGSLIRKALESVR